MKYKTKLLELQNVSQELFMKRKNCLCQFQKSTWLSSVTAD